MREKIRCVVSPYIPPVVDGWVWMQVHPCSQLDKLLKQMAVAAKVVQHKGFPTVQDEIQSSKAMHMHRDGIAKQTICR